MDGLIAYTQSLVGGNGMVGRLSTILMSTMLGRFVANGGSFSGWQVEGIG